MAFYINCFRYLSTKTRNLRARSSTLVMARPTPYNILGMKARSPRRAPRLAMTKTWMTKATEMKRIMGYKAPLTDPVT